MLQASESTAILNGEPISVMPVPNKVQRSVLIKAKDLDHSATPVKFSIASTIPPGHEDMFTVSTSMTGSGEYAATITPTSTTKVNHGFEIFLKAEEQSYQRRFEVAMIFFEDPNNVCASGHSPGTSSGQTGDNNGAEMDDNNEDEKYTEPVIALIVVVAILATLVLCLAVAFLCTLRNRSSAATSRNNDVTLTHM